MMDLASLRVELVQESRDLLSEMEVGLLSMEREGPTDERIHAVFRAAHTIKGSVGLFGLQQVVDFTHAMETVLDEARGHRLGMDDVLIALFLECLDHLRALIGGVEANADLETVEPEARSVLMARLKDYFPRTATRALVQTDPMEPHVETLEREFGERVECRTWHLSFRPSRETLRNGVDLVELIRQVATLGEIVHLEVVDDHLPLLSQLDPAEMWLGFEIQLASNADRQRIEEVFEVLPEGSVVRILPPNARIGEYLGMLATLPESTDRLGELLVECKALTPRELERVLRIQKDSTETKSALGSILVAEQIVPPIVVASALQKQKIGRHHVLQDSRIVKVEAEKLDALIDLVGELIIASAGARMATIREGAKASQEAVANLAQLVESIRDNALGLRMVPIGDVFQRFPRVVRDLAKDLGKKIGLSITGAETELDKALVDRISDPLMHIVRNAIDHGIESESVRLAAGKSSEGELGFHAYHETGSIVIEVRDDGAGICRDKVLKRATERGIVAEGQILSDHELLQLIFEPGFSTAEQVTNLSGRGVGMDVVKKSIETLRGEIELESVEGEGTTIRLRLPLTLAIIDGFEFLVGEEAYVVPLDMVKECADFVVSDIFGGIVRLRGEPLPFLRLREIFAVPDPPPRRESLVVVQYGQRRVGLVVDQLVGELQAVIKPLGPLLRNLKAVGGTTVLGTGSIALVLDIHRLIQMVASRNATAISTFANTSH